MNGRVDKLCVVINDPAVAFMYVAEEMKARMNPVLNLVSKYSTAVMLIASVENAVRWPVRDQDIRIRGYRPPTPTCRISKLESEVLVIWCIWTTPNLKAFDGNAGIAQIVYVWQRLCKPLDVKTTVVIASNP